VDLTRWTPIRLTWHGDGRPAVDWCHTEGITFTEPFFAQTVDRCLAHPFRVLFRQSTDLDTLCRAVEDQPGQPPAGFVFHLSRCGSTLVAQMLAAVAEHVVLSEAAPLEAVLRAAEDPDAVRWLRGMVGALGQPRDPRHRRVFVKFDAWSTLQLPLIRRAFPGVPWLFLYRDPVEVLVSHARRPGAHMIPGVLPGASFALDEGGSLVEYAARVLGLICEAALVFDDDPLATFVDYSRLRSFMATDLSGAWSLPLDDDARARMAAAAQLDAKNPVLAFADDRTAKQAAATDDIRSAAARWLDPLYARLRDAGVSA
jgi:hypothetical protein